MRHQSQWDARAQIAVAQTSQVKLRAAQSRVFETVDRRRIVEAIISTLQDLHFSVDVVDEEIGIVSGKFFLPLEESVLDSAFYNFYDRNTLLLFTKTFRVWGPFWQRSNTVRVTVTVRQRNDRQSVVRANAQYYLQGVEEPAIYQQFFRALEQSMFLQAHEL